jgi:hypothetical protein
MSQTFPAYPSANSSYVINGESWTYDGTVWNRSSYNSNYTGYTGSIGYVGSQAYTGSQGYTGSTGFQGMTGYTGSRGLAGNDGINATGFAGSQGYTGSTATPPGGSNTQVQYNNSGAFAGNANLTFNGTGLTAGQFIPSSASIPANGMFLQAANTLGFSSNSQASDSMLYKNYQIGSTGYYVNQLSLGNGVGIDTANYQNLYVRSYTGDQNQCSTNTGLIGVYTYNNNTPFRSAQINYASSNYVTTDPSRQYCTIGLSVAATGSGWTPAQFSSGSFQTFPAIGVYAEANSQVGNQAATAFYGLSDSVYSNGTAFYARTKGQAPTSGGSFCYRAELGSHIFGGSMVGYHSRIVSGQGTGTTYANAVGWFHVDETGSGLASYAAKFQKAGTDVGNITLSTTNTTYTTSSDPRLKNITGAITADEAKTFVMSLQPKKGTWKADGSYFQGFVSTEYAPLDPKSVHGVAGASEILGRIIDKDGKVLNENVVDPTPKLPEGGRWEQTHVKDIYQTLEYGSSAWCANMTAHAQYLQNTIEQLIVRIAALESK